MLDKKTKFKKPKVTKKHQKEKIEKAIQLLNDVVKIRVGPSTIHGVGVIAMRNIKKGEKLYADSIPHMLDVPYKDFKKLRPEIAELILGRFPQIVNGSHFMYPDTKMQAYMNHSVMPNYDAQTDKALRKIRKGDEITEDYRKIEGYEKVYPWLAK